MVTLKDIALEAGVSLAAASMAMNDHPSISRHTKSRVWEVQRRLGYRPNRHARLLRKRFATGAPHCLTTGNLAFLLIGQTFEDPSYSPLFQGVAEIAAEQNLHPFYHSLKSEDLRADRLPQLIRNREVDGLIVSGYYGEAEHQVFGRLSLPKVLLGNYEVKEPITAVETDVSQGMRSVMERLHAMGHRRIALVMETMDIFIHQQMFRSFREESVRLFGPFDPDLAQISGQRFEGGRAPAARALSLSDRPTAIVLGTERLAAAVYDLCAERALRIPQDCSVVSFGVGGAFYHYRPALTVVQSDAGAMGRAAVNKLFEMLARSVVLPHRTVFPMFIKEGASWGPGTIP